MGPLAGVKIVEMSAIGPVPLAGMLLADMGADVVLIDKAGDPFRFPNDVIRRGKRAYETDLKSPQGTRLVSTLIDKADIVLEGFRPGVMERLGLGPEVFEESNPGLIYGRVTGWGQTGPLAQNYIALTGALNAIGRAEHNPTPPLNLIGDYGGGTMFLIMGVLAALHERKGSGKGQVVDAAITEGTANLMTLFYTMNNLGLWSTQRGVNLLDSAAHFYDTYQTKDKKYVSIGAIEPHFYAIMREKMGLDDTDFDAQNDPAKWPELKLKIANKVATKTRDEWCQLLEGSDACFAPVLDYLEAAEHPHMKARDAYQNLNGVIQPAPAPKFSRTPSRTRQTDSAGDVSDVIREWS